MIANRLFKLTVKDGRIFDRNNNEIVPSEWRLDFDRVIDNFGCRLDDDHIMNYKDDEVFDYLVWIRQVKAGKQYVPKRNRTFDNTLAKTQVSAFSQLEYHI